MWISMGTAEMICWMMLTASCLASTLSAAAYLPVIYCCSYADFVILPPPNMMENTFIMYLPRAESEFKPHDAESHGLSRVDRSLFY